MTAAHTLPSILAVARAAGLDLPGTGRPKQSLCCPFHEDTTPSAFLDEARGCFYCSVCTPGHGWGVSRFSDAVRILPGLGNPLAAPQAQGTHAPGPNFGPAEALAVWQMAVARARDDGSIEADSAAYEYLRDRGVIGSWETASFGLLASDMRLPPAIASWPGTGHVVVAPLYDAAGTLTNIQARAIRPAARKTLFPKGSRARGTMFASRSALDVLRRRWAGQKLVVLGEGLTDFLALSVACPVPVLSAPGTGCAVHGIGPWIAGFDVLLALDDDAAGANARMPTAEAAYRQGARSVRRVIWPGHSKDACEVIERRGIESLTAFLTREMEVSTHA